MKIKVGCSTEESFVASGDTVVASWSLGFGGSECTVGKEYKVEGIKNKNLIIENDNRTMKEYSPLHFTKK